MPGREAQTYFAGGEPTKKRTWRNLYRRVRLDGIEMSVAVASDGLVVIRTGQSRAFLEIDEVVHVELALRAAREGEP